MKKVNIVIAVLGTVALVSCVQEINNESTLIGENGIAFSVKGGVSTRAGEEVAAVTHGVTIPLGMSEDGGTSFYLEETVIDLDAATPITRGTPAYTENLGVLYGNDMSVHAFGQDAVFETMDEKQQTDGGWRYFHQYGGNPWPEDGSAVDFYLRMPATQAGVAADSYSYGKADGKGTITFSYTSPGTAGEMQDILFGYTSMTQAQHRSFQPKGAPVLFNHALTGVKFAIGNKESDIETNSIVITKVVFSGLYDKGICTITPASENNGADITDTYSSALAAQWDPESLDFSTADVTLSSGDYEGIHSFAAGGSFGENGGSYPDSFAAAGNEMNLGDQSASQTFWFIPQPMTDDVKLTIYYSFGDVENHWTIDFGSVLTGITWKAGQLRTYTIKIDDVNLMIEDNVTTTSEVVDGVTLYKGTKNGIKITNTGNTDAFIRVAITGEWMDNQDNPVFSFTDFKNPDSIIQEIDSWYNDQFGTGSGYFGVFDGLVGYTKNNKDGSGNAGWVKGNDGYYYYTSKVAPKAQTGTAPFNTYEVRTVPQVRVAGALQDVHFELEISSQAISAKQLDTSDYTWAQAWTNALGYDPSSSN